MQAQRQRRATSLAGKEPTFWAPSSVYRFAAATLLYDGAGTPVLPSVSCPCACVTTTLAATTMAIASPRVLDGGAGWCALPPAIIAEVLLLPAVRLPWLGARNACDEIREPRRRHLAPTCFLAGFARAAPCHAEEAREARA